MQEDKIIEILQFWNFWQKDLPTGILREKYVFDLVRQSRLKEASVVVGVRRSGKSTMLLQVLKSLIKKGVPRENTLYINFEEPAFDKYLNLEFLLKIYQVYQERLSPKGKIYLVLDEVHLVPRWEKFVRGLYDRGEKIKFYLTGSAAHLLSREFGTVLTGRIYSNEIFPLDFREYLAFKKQEKLLSLSRGKGSIGLRHQFREYLKFGGFPQVVLTKTLRDKTQILKDYYAAIIEKDIVQRYKVRDIKKLKEFCLDLMTNISAKFSGYQAEKKLGLSQPTANKFLDYLKDVFLIQTAHYFSYSLRQQKANPYKVYAIDSGLYRAVSFRFSQNLGRIFENLVFLCLRQRGKEIFYWQGKNEVDFVVRKGRKIQQLINVCWQLSEDNREREIAGLREGMKKFGLKKAELITMDYQEKIKIKEGVIETKNFFSWI